MSPTLFINEFYWVKNCVNYSPTSLERVSILGIQVVPTHIGLFPLNVLQLYTTRKSFPSRDICRAHLNRVAQPNIFFMDESLICYLLEFFIFYIDMVIMYVYTYRQIRVYHQTNCSLSTHTIFIMVITISRVQKIDIFTKMYL